MGNLSLAYFTGLLCFSPFPVVIGLPSPLSLFFILIWHEMMMIAVVVPSLSSLLSQILLSHFSHRLPRSKTLFFPGPNTQGRAPTQAAFCLRIFLIWNEFQIFHFGFKRNFKSLCTCEKTDDIESFLSALFKSVPQNLCLDFFLSTFFLHCTKNVKSTDGTLKASAVPQGFLSRMWLQNSN